MYAVWKFLKISVSWQRYSITYFLEYVIIFVWGYFAKMYIYLKKQYY